MQRTDVFRRVHVGSLALCLVLLPWSTALLSMAQMLFAANWILGGIIEKDNQRWGRAFGSAPTLLFLGILVTHVIGLLWTSEAGMSWGIDLTRTLLPVLVFGVVLSSSPGLTDREFRWVLLIGAWSVIASTLVSLAIRGMQVEYRQLSAFISHIRLALMLCLSVVVFLYYLDGPLWTRLAHLAAVAWAFFYINLLGSLQAWGILLVVSLVLFWVWTKRLTSVKRWAYRTLSLVPVVLGAIWAGSVVLERYTGTGQADVLHEHSPGGEIYMHHHGDQQRENGSLVWSNIAWAEVHRVWPARSERPLNGKDDKGHVLYATLFRYLTSKGLAKDSVGVMALSDADVKRIESGIPNAAWGTRSRSRDRLDEILFEVDQYITEGQVSGHSLTMRLEYWRAGWQIFKRNPWIGIGTGDTQGEFDAQYERMNSSLAMQWRHRAHNQYLTFLISFGLIGTVIIACCLWIPARKHKASHQALFIAWALIICIGSLTDDTIETQAGATFFALYYALFVFAAPRQQLAEPVTERKPLARPEAVR